MDIETIIKKTISAEKALAANLETTPRDNLAGQQMRKNQAGEELKKLRKEYETTVAKTLDLTLGDNLDKLSPQDYLVFDYNQFYNDMLATVTSFYPPRVTPSDIALMRKFTIDAARDMGIDDYDHLEFANTITKSVPSKQALLVELQKIAEASRSNYLVDMYLKKCIMDTLFNGKYLYFRKTAIKNVPPNKYKAISAMFSGSYVVNEDPKTAPNISKAATPVPIKAKWKAK